MMWGYGPWYGNGSWMGLVMMVVQMLFWGLIIWLGVSLFTKGGRSSRLTNKRNEAMDILRERYSQGQIDTEEFNRRKEDLMR